ncbi:CPBP family intramembrane metalloprotease [Halobacteria archaeon AArc-dxtr1]|nr:CPBP family intramembrane metalloprotease [Halobacteria archaeon AArc-dxtr1]
MNRAADDSSPGDAPAEPPDGRDAAAVPDGSATAADVDATDPDGNPAPAGGPEPDRTVTLVGFLFAAVALVGLLATARQDATIVAIWLGVGTGSLALVICFARRHGLLGRRIAGIGAVASALTVVLAGYAALTGVTGSVAVPGVDWTLSGTFTAFLAAGGAAGTSVADYGGVSRYGFGQRVVSGVELSAVGLLGQLAIPVAQLLLAAPLFLLVGDLTPVQLQTVSYLSFGLGFGAVAIGYLVLKGYDRSYLDLRAPTVWTLLWIAAGVAVLFVANIGIGSLLSVIGAETAGHTTMDAAEENPDLLLVIVPAMLLIVGPAEELLFRNVIQKSLYDTFSTAGAIVVTSVPFAIVHVGAYATAGASELLASLLGVFVLSILLGAIYARTENLLVPALAHGGYNALLVVVLLG